MFDNDSMIDLLGVLPVRSNKSAVRKAPMPISNEQRLALGTTKRTILRYVKTAISAISDKLEIQRVTINDVQSNLAVEQWLTANAFDLLQKDIYKALVRDGVTYIHVAYADGIPALSQVDSYDGNIGAATIHNPLTGKPEYTVNVWYVGNQKNIDVYYPDRIEKYYYDLDDAAWKIRKDYDNEAWPIDWTDDNDTPLGIALVKFDIGESDITEAVQLQSDLNEAHLDMLATSRTMGWPQRVLKNASKETYLLNQYEQPLMFDATGTAPIPRKIELTPGSILMLQGADSDLEQLPQAEISTVAMDKIEQLITQFTTVPQYYFGKGDWPSGVALLNAEMRLNHKVESHQAYITPALQQVLKMMLRLNNTFGNTSFNTESRIEILWFPPAVEDEAIRREKRETLSKVVTQEVREGVRSLESAVRLLNPDWDETAIADEVARIQAARNFA